MCAGLHLGDKNSLAPEAKPGDKLINGPLLVVNGTRDAGNPVPDLVSTYQSAKEGDLWLLGRGEHCAVDRAGASRRAEFCCFVRGLAGHSSHGWANSAISPANTINYFGTVVATHHPAQGK